MFTARFLQPDRNTINVAPSRRSKLIARRAAMRCPQVVPTQPPSDITTDTVAPEKAMALAVVDETKPACIQLSVNDLAIAAAEPNADMPGDEPSAPAPVDDVAIPIEPSPFTPETTASPDTGTSSAPPTKAKKRGRKRENSVPGAVRPKPSPRRKRRVNEGVARASAVGEEVENSG